MKRKKTLWHGVAVLLVMAGFFVFTGIAIGEELFELGSIAQYYEPVQFDHELHVGLIADDECATCHHHTLGTPVLDPICQRCHENSQETEVVACRDCHPAKRFSAAYLASLEEDINLFHQEKPGLQGAFHQKCLECHMEYGAPAGCQDCHARTEAGDKFYHSDKYSPAPTAESSGH